MKFEAVIQALRDGKKIRRDTWDKDDYIKSNNGSIEDEDGADYDLVKGILFDNWEIVKEKVKKYQFLFGSLVTMGVPEELKKIRLSSEKYSSLKDFESKNLFKVAIKLVPETEEEFDV